MKSTLLFIALALLLGVKAHSYVDNSWMSASYGAPGDTVVVKVVKQVKDYEAARSVAYAIQSGQKEGNLRAAQQECVDLALYSYVKAMYAAEMGRVAALSGDKSTAIKDYKLVVKYANAALASSKHIDSGSGESSYDVAKDFKSLAQKALNELE